LIDLHNEKNSLYKNVQDLYNDLSISFKSLKVAAANVIDDEDDIVKKKMVKAKSDYYAVRSRASDFLESSKAVEPQHDKVSDSYSLNSFVEFKKLPVPSWDGRLRSYLHFKATFKRLVENGANDDFALVRLQQEALRKDSREELFVRSKSDLSSAWETLDSAFGRANMIRDSILHDLDSVPEVSEVSDVKGLRLLITEVERAREDLRQCRRESALGESAFGIIMQKLPSVLRREIDREILKADMDSIESFNYLLMTCELIVTAEEVHHLRCEASNHSQQSYSVFPGKGIEILDTSSRELIRKTTTVSWAER
jgi:hypothetical protein